MPQRGIEFVKDAQQADLVVAHAGTKAGKTADVVHCHGLYPTATVDTANLYFNSNADVIDSIRHAITVTVPSAWVGLSFQRDMGFSPTIVPHGIDIEDWPKSTARIGRYILWAKGHNPGVCDASVVNALAAKLPNWQFITTFGDVAPNVRVIGPQPFPEMKKMLQGAAVYLATTKETFGIQTLEAMASGIPVVGYDWGGIQGIITHKQDGYLAKPGDIGDLVEGVIWVWKHKNKIAANARRAVESRFGWGKVCDQLVELYQSTLNQKRAPSRVSVVIPCHNYAHYLGAAVDSVLNQKRKADEIIIVDDGSTDNTKDVAAKYGDKVRYLHTEGVGVAFARDFGIQSASHDLVACLDADDSWRSVFLDVLVPAFADRSLGLAYGSLTAHDIETDKVHTGAWPPSFDYKEQLARHNCVPSSCVFRKEAWRRVGGYRPQYTPAEDAELWLRIASVGYGVKKVVDAPVYIYNTHANSLSRTIPEPDWTADKPWSQFPSLAPFAAPAIGKQPSNPFRNYDDPWVSVIIPVGPGHESTVWKAIDSVVAQSMPYWEVIVALDTDKVPVQTTTGQPLDKAYPFIKMVQAGVKAGPGRARNVGASISRAPVLAFLDADDGLLPDFLLHSIQVYNSNNPLMYVYTDWYGWDGKELKPNQAKEFDPKVLINEALHPITALVPRAWHNEIGGFDEKLDGWEDWDYYLKMVKAGHCGMRLAEHLTVYNYASGQRRESSLKSAKSLLKAIRSRYREADMGCGSCRGNKARAAFPPPGEPRSAGKVTQRGGVAMNDRRGEATDEMIMVMENSGNYGGHAVTGARTKTKYGRMSHGEKFLMHSADQQAQPRTYIRLEEAQLPTIPDVSKPVEPVMAEPAKPVEVPKPVEVLTGTGIVDEDGVDISLLDLGQIQRLGIDAETAVDAIEAERANGNRQDVLEYLESLLVKEPAEPTKRPRGRPRKT